MKEHELTDEQIEWGKNNPLPVNELNGGQIEILQMVNHNDLLWYQRSKDKWTTARTENEDTCEIETSAKDIRIFRIRPDYQRPEPPQVEKWIECHVVKDFKGDWSFQHPFRERIEYVLSRAVDIVGFGGVHFEGAKGWWRDLAAFNVTTSSQSSYVSDDDMAFNPATPQKVRFLNPEYKGE